MKRATTVAAAILLALALGGCGGSADAPADTGAGGSETVEQPEVSQQEAPEAADSDPIYESASMRVWYEGTEDLAPMGLAGMLQTSLVVENLSGETCMFAPVPGACACNNFNVTMTGGALEVDPGNKAACVVQLAYSQQTDAQSFEDVKLLHIVLQQTGSDVVNPIEVHAFDVDLS